MNNHKMGNGIGAYRYCCIILFLLIAFTPSAAAADTMFRADPLHTGVFDNGGILPTKNEQWRFATVGLVSSSPAVSDGVVYVGSYDKNLYAIDAVTGKEQWRFATGGAVSSSPAVLNGVVYVGSYDKNLYAIDAVTGGENWRFATGSGVWSSPGVSNGVVYIGSDDKNLYAIDALSGKEKWRFATGSDLSSSPAVSNGVVYVGSYDKNLYAIDALSGKEKWRFKTRSYVHSSPAVSNGVVYVGSLDENLYAIDALSGAEKWRFATGGGEWSSPGVSNGVVYVGSRDTNLYAIDAVTGKEQWRFKTGNYVDSSPALSNGIVYVGSLDGNLYAIDGVTGREQWRFATSGGVYSSPAVSNGIVYAGSYDTNLYAVGGTSTRQITTPTIAPTSAPTIPVTPSLILVPCSQPWCSADSNLTLLIIALLVVLFLAGGGYAIYRVKRKPSDTQTPERKDITAIAPHSPSSGASSGRWNPASIENQLNRIASVERKASVLPQFRSPVQALITKAREQYRSGAYDAVQTTLITAEDAITSLALCETRLKQWKKEGYTTTSLESLKTDNITNTNAAFRNFEQDIATLKQHERHVQELKRSCSTVNVDPAIYQSIAGIESQLHDPHNITAIGREIEAIEQQILRDQQERVKQLHDTEQLFTRLHEKAEKLTLYAPLITGSFTEARDQIIAMRYDEARKILLRIEDPIDALLECESLLATWKSKGYIIPELEGLHPRNTGEVFPLFKNNKQNINRLQAIKQDLESKKRTYPNFFEQPEIASIVFSIEQNLYNPSLIDTVEKDYQQLIDVVRQQEDKQKIIEQNLSDQVEKVQREAGSPAIKEEIAPVIKCIRQGDFSLAKEMLRNLAGQQLSRLNAALSMLETDGVVVSLSSDPIQEQIAAENYGDAIIDSEKVIAEIAQIQEDKQKIIEQNLRDQAEKVQREAGSPAIKEEIVPIIKSIRQGDFPRAKEMLRNLAGQQLSRLNAALSMLGTDGAVVSLSSDPIREQIAAENYGDAIIDSEKVIAEIAQIQEDKQKIIEQNLRDQAEKVQLEAGSPAIKEEITPIMKCIRQRDFTLAKEMLRNLAGQQLSRLNAALSMLGTDGAVISLSSDPIREQIAAENYGDAIIDSEKANSELTRIYEVYAKAKVMRSTVTEPAILALFENGKYEEFISASEEQQRHTKKVTELKEKGIKLLGDAEQFGEVPKRVHSKLDAQDIPAIESAIRELETFSLTAKPELSLSLDRTQLSAGEWHKVEIQIKNAGSAHAVDVNLSFSDDFDTRWIEPTEVESGKTAGITIGILPKKKGNIPLEISCLYKNRQDKPYQQKFRFWIDVVDRMNMTPGQGTATPPQSPVTRFTPRPLTLKQLPQDLSDRYTESEFIGKGGFARVFKAKRKDGKYVAVKIPISMDASTGKSFIAEMQNWTRLNHPNIVKLYDFNIMPMPYFEMELCDNSLADRKKPVESEEAAWILFNVCEGLKFTHSNKIIHRDLKPQNILLKNGVPKISDWGLSRVISESTSTTTTSFTPYYAAPEQISSEHKDERTDIWQLGVIFYELVTGQLPFTGDSMVAVMAAIATKNPVPPSVIDPSSQVVESMIMKCLEKNPGKRYQSVLELQKDLALYLRVTYTESLKLSVTVNDLRRSASYCGDLVMVNLLTGDMKSAYKYLLEFVHYSKGDVKAEAQELSEQIKMRMEMGVLEIPEELIQKAEFIVHRVSLGFRDWK